jgi:hypothetical protein
VSEEQAVTATAAERGRRKVRTGVVVSDKMEKTVLVRIDRTVTLYQLTNRNIFLIYLNHTGDRQPSTHTLKNETR